MKVREATIKDTSIITETIIGALHLEIPVYDQIFQACLDKDTLYYKDKAIILYDFDYTAGCIVSYSGKEYLQLRNNTWDKAWPGISLPDQPESSSPDEWYIDSLYIVPEYRGHDYGKLLIDAAEKRAKMNNAKYMGLLADKNAPNLIKYYMRMGFQPQRTQFFFGNEYRRMTKQLI